MADHVIYYQSNFICVMGWELEVIVCVLLVDVKLLGKGLGYIGVGDLGLALRAGCLGKRVERKKAKRFLMESLVCS